LEQAKRVRDFLTDSDTECLLWPDAFEPGYLTFEALETVLARVCAAVLIATPDDPGKIHDRDVKMPRANVMLEFGLLAGRLGRHNVAVCQFGDVEMPSDLQGMTVVRMGGEQESSSKQKLAVWRSRLAQTIQTVARTDIVHGYSGVWDFEIALDRWRGIALSAPSTSTARGMLSLYLDPEGRSGFGFGWGRLTSEIHSDNVPVYISEFRACHKVLSATCLRDGGLSLRTQIFALHRMYMQGTPPRELEGLDGPPEGWSFGWELSPADSDGILAGDFHTDIPNLVTRGRVTLRKLPRLP